MTSLNISLPEALKEYVEGQVASGDWGTPSEYVRELIRRDKERRLGDLEHELVAAAKGRKIELPVAEIRRKGLVAVLRQRADSLKLEQLRRDIREGLDSGPARPWSFAEMKREGRKLPRASLLQVDAQSVVRPRVSSRSPEDQSPRPVARNATRMGHPAPSLKIKSPASQAGLKLLPVGTLSAKHLNCSG